MPSKPLVRSLTLLDLEAILRIDQANTKTKRGTEDNDLWRLIAETTTCFGAEVDGKLAGFVLADVRPWEFGNRAPVGWVIVLGVDPKHQGKGLGTMLGKRVVQAFHAIGVSEIKTLVGDADDGLRKYFESLGFRATKETVLRMSNGTRRHRAGRGATTRGRARATGTRRR